MDIRRLFFSAARLPRLHLSSCFHLFLFLCFNLYFLHILRILCLYFLFCLCFLLLLFLLPFLSLSLHMQNHNNIVLSGAIHLYNSSTRCTCTLSANASTSNASWQIICFSNLDCNYEAKPLHPSTGGLALLATTQHLKKVKTTRCWHLLSYCLSISRQWL